MSFNFTLGAKIGPAVIGSPFRYEYNTNKEHVNLTDELLDEAIEEDGVEPNIIHQSKMPHFRETAPFTTEVPRQLSREQYYHFFDEQADPLAGEREGKSARARGIKPIKSLKRTAKEMREEESFSEKMEKIEEKLPVDPAKLQEMFEALLKEVEDF